MPRVTVFIDNKQITVDSDMTVLEAAKSAGIHIPALCHFEGLQGRANCRMCVVEIEGTRGLQPACVTKISDGMSVHTDTEQIRKARKMNLQLIMSDHAVDCHHCLRIGSSREPDLDPKFCEMCFFCDCVRDGFCELQSLCREYHVDVLPFVQHADEHPIDESLGSISRNANKCIKCRRCVDMCNDVQTVYNLSMSNRGRDICVVAELGHAMADSTCVRCGHCVDVCPCGALYMKESIDKIIFTAHSYDCRTAAMVDSGVLPELRRLFCVSEDAIRLEHVAAALHKQGVDFIIDSSAMEHRAAARAAEIIRAALDKDGRQPVIITNSFAAGNFVRRFFPELEESVISYHSTQAEFHDYVEQKYPGKNCRTVVLSSKNEDGAEKEETGIVDFCINAREYYRMCMRTGGAPARRVPQPLDVAEPQELPMGYEMLLGSSEFDMTEESEKLTLELDGRMRAVAIAHNLGQCRRLLEQIKNGNCGYDVVRLQA